MNIAKHISELIPFHECVIVPDFGGFISNYRSARVNVLRDSFSPPGKEVIFNNKINKNDGLLINHIAEKEHISYQRAENCVMNFVERLNAKLYKGEAVSFDELGTFRFDSAGNLLFSSEIEFSLIESYGLNSFKFQAANSLANYQERPAIRAVQRKKDVVKIAASVALILTLSLYPFQNKNSQTNSSDLSPFSVLSALNAADPDDVVEENMPKIEKVVSKPYLLIGGSFKAQENATELKNELSEKGHQSEIIKIQNGYFRVVIDSYLSKEEAIRAMKSYRSENEGSNAWVSIR